MSELAEFLRSRRERLSPADVGIADNGRRRTPGLRREEVATLAGVSIDYLIRLEQGRDTNPSPAVLGALATALRLSDEEKRYLGMVGHEHAAGLCPSTTTASRDVPPTVLMLLDRLEPSPAFVSGPFGDLLAWTDAFEQLVTPLGLLEPEMGNLARFVFLHPASRDVYADWETAADEQVQRLRSASMRWMLDDALVALRHDLETVPEFVTRWADHEVAEQRRGTTWLAHPALGRLQVAYEVMSLADDDEQRLVTWLPADETTATAFDRLGAPDEPSSPARLRVV